MGKRSGFWTVQALPGLLLLALLAASTACDNNSLSTQPLVLGGLFNLTGAVAVADGPANRGVLLAIKQQNAAGGIHGRPIQYTVQDTATDPAKITAATNTALATNPVALIGYDDTDSVLSAGPLAQKAGVPFVTVGATSPHLPGAIGDSIFLACFGDNVQAAVAAEFLYNTIKARRLYMLTNQGTEYTRTLAGYFKTRWNQLLPGGIVLSDTYQLNDTDFSAQIGRLKTIQPPPDAMYIAAYPDELPNLLPALRAAGFTQPIVGGDGYDGADIFSIGGKPTMNVFYTTHGMLPAPASGPMHDFAVAYTAEYAKAPESVFAALGYDSARLLFDAMTRAPDAKPASLRAALEATKGFVGATGTLTFGPAPDGHVPNKSVTVVEIHDGQARAAAVATPEVVPPP